MQSSFGIMFAELKKQQQNMRLSVARTRIGILRPLLLVQHPPKLMELTLVLSVYYSQEKKERKEEKSHFV